VSSDDQQPQLVSFAAILSVHEIGPTESAFVVPPWVGAPPARSRLVAGEGRTLKCATSLARALLPIVREKRGRHIHTLAGGMTDPQRLWTGPTRCEGCLRIQRDRWAAGAMITQIRSPGTAEEINRERCPPTRFAGQGVNRHSGGTCKRDAPRMGWHTGNAELPTSIKNPPSRPLKALLTAARAVATIHPDHQGSTTRVQRLRQSFHERR
jgi:hypothetical protein